MQKSRAHQGELWGLLNLLDLEGERPKMRDVVRGRKLQHKIKDFQPPLEALAAVNMVLSALQRLNKSRIHLPCFCSRLGMIFHLIQAAFKGVTNTRSSNVSMYELVIDCKI